MAWAKKKVLANRGFPSPHSMGHNFGNGPLIQKSSFGAAASVSEPYRTKLKGHYGNVAASISNIFAGLEYVPLTKPGVANRTFGNRTQSNLIELNLWIEFD